MNPKKQWITKKTAPYIFIAPVLIIFIVFMAYPIGRSFYLSFFEMQGGEYQFVGLKNYQMLMKDKVFFKAIGNTFIFLAVQVPVMVASALLIAVAIEQKFIRGRALFRTSIFLPSVTALVAYALVFKVLFNADYGVINYVLSLFGGEGVRWFYTEWGARLAVIISITWRWTGYNMIILMAGIQAIPGDMMEAADIDGATFWDKLFRITIPLIKPVLLFTVITSTIGTLQLFDEPYVLTEGGPNNATITMGQYLYVQGFKYLKFGYASAVGYVMAVIISIFSLIQLKLSRGTEE